MDKLKMHSRDLTQDHIAKLRALFPGCVTEARGEDGRVRLAVDFDLLRQELSDTLVEGPRERYQLNWPGKREALLTANAPIAKTLRPEGLILISIDDAEQASLRRMCDQVSNALAACFDAGGQVDEGFVKELATHKPLLAVFRDAGFKDSAAKINVEQIFKLLSPGTEAKCI